MRLGGRKDSGPTPSAPAQGALAALTTTSGVAIAAVVAALAATLVLSAPDRAAEARQRAEHDAAAVAGQLAARIAPRRATLDSLAGTSALHDALAAGDRESLVELARLWRPAFPDAARLLIAPAGGLEARPQADPPVGYALSDMVGEAIDSGRTRVEVHHAGGNEGQLNLVAPARRAGEALGALVVTYPADELTRSLNTGVDWRLVQTVGGTRSTVAVQGTPGDGSTVTATVSGTPWRVERPVPPVPTGLAALDWQPAAIAGAGAVLLIALAGAILGRRLRAALQHDGDRVTALVEDLCEGQLQLRYPTATSELAGAMGVAVARARAAGPIGGVDDSDSQGDAPRERTTATAEPDHGLEVTETPADDDTPGDEAPAPPAAAPDASTETDEPPRPAPAAGENMTMDFTHGLASGATHAPTTRIDRSILRAYDIRGVVGETLTVDSVRALGQAIGSEAAARGQSRLVVGYDGRHSSPELAAALTEGLVAAGREVIEIGCVPTPVVYFAAHFLSTEAGVAITGSHNPPEYNGLKMVVGGETLSGEAIQDLGRRIAEGDLVTGEGSSRHRDVAQDYLDRITQDVALHRPLKLVIDCGNGVAGNLAPALFRALGCEVTELYCDVDGDFPNHHPDPTVPDNLTDLIEAVRAGGADLGIAFDGDGDRLGVVDDRGKIIWADRQMMLFARDVLSRQPGSDIIFDVKCTSQLADVITENAGVPLMWKTGHSLVKAKLRETGAPLAGEMSGHIFFQERWYGFDDGLYAAARLLEILSMEDREAHAVFDELPEAVSTPELRVELAEGEPPEVMARLMAEAQTFEAARIADIDGLRVDFPDGWGLVRASNTQPSLVLRFEGNDEAALTRIQDLFRERLNAARPGLQLPF